MVAFLRSGAAVSYVSISMSFVSRVCECVCEASFASCVCMFSASRVNVVGVNELCDQLSVLL